MTGPSEKTNNKTLKRTLRVVERACPAFSQIFVVFLSFFSLIQLLLVLLLLLEQRERETLGPVLSCRVESSRGLLEESFVDGSSKQRVIGISNVWRRSQEGPQDQKKIASAGLPETWQSVVPRQRQL